MVGKLAAVGIAVAALAAAGIWYALRPSSASDMPLSMTAQPSSPTNTSPFTGTASCSGRACHGSLEPSSERPGIQQNEYTTWLMHDRHAHAYDALTERSQLIAKNLGLPHPAHEEKRCLVCHTNPAATVADLQFPAEERRAGVGCETCHGPARDWLGPHTAWSDLDSDQKRPLYQKYGMTWLEGPRARAEMCVRCHVGQKDADVNHDLIAAGHPRLEFELTAFLANMPPHWIEKDNEATREAKAWAVGQVVTARAALELLEQRANSKMEPWPEFAEYDCFSCHHDLRDREWRRNKAHLDGRVPGSLPWNERYFLFLPEIIGARAAPKPLDHKQLASDMTQPMSNRKRVAEFAHSGASSLEELLPGLEKKSYTSDDVLKLIAAVTNDRATIARNWDAAAQTYLALDALRRAVGMDRNEPVEKALGQFGNLLAFPPKTASPGDYRQDTEFDARLAKILEQLQGILAPGSSQPAPSKPKP